MMSLWFRIARFAHRWWSKARSASSTLHRPRAVFLGAEPLESRDLFAVIDFASGTLSISLAADEKVALAVNAEGELSIESDLGLTVLAAGQSLGFAASANAGETIISNDAVFAAVDLLAFVGDSGGGQSIRFGEGNFATNLSFADNIEQIDFEAAASFGDILSYANEQVSILGALTVSRFELLGTARITLEADVESFAPQIFGGNVEIGGALVELTSESQINFFGTVNGRTNGGQSLSIVAEAGIAFLRDVGNTARLLSLSASAAGTVQFDSNTTAATQTYLSSDEQGVIIGGDLPVAAGTTFTIYSNRSSVLNGAIQLLQGDDFPGHPSNGTLIIEGYSDFVIHGWLYGTGIVHANGGALRFSDRGVFSPGARALGPAGTAGTLVIDGASPRGLVFESGSIFGAQLFGKDSIDLVFCEGSVTIAPGAVLHVFSINPPPLSRPDFYPAYGTPYTLIRTPVGIAGKFSYAEYHEGDELTLTPGHGVDQFGLVARVGYARFADSEFTDVSFAPLRFIQFTKFIAVGADAGTPRYDLFVYDALTLTPFSRFDPFGKKYQGPVRTAVGDVNGDLVDDVIVTTGAGPRTQIKIYDGRTIDLHDRPFREVTEAPPIVLFPFGRSFKGGAHLATANVNEDRALEIVVGSGIGIRATVAYVDGRGALMYAFNPFSRNYTLGVTVAGGDLNRDGFDEVIVGMAARKSQIRVFDGNTNVLLANFRAFSSGVQGVFVAAGDVDGDGAADIVAGNVDGSRSDVRTFDGTTLQHIDRFRPFAPDFRGGVRVATTDVDGDGMHEILMAPGKGERALVRIRNFDTGVVVDFYAIAKNFTGGVYVG